MEDYNYDALSSSIKFEDVTSSKTNQDILRRLKENDIDKLWICNEETTDGDDRDYIPFNDEDDMGWLGYFIGNSTSLEAMYLLTLDMNGIGALFRGMNSNRSITKIVFGNENSRLDGNIFGMLDQFFKNNHNLMKIEVSGCSLMDEDVRQLSLTLGSCNKSLKYICVEDSEIGDGQMVDIILALSMHPQLEEIDLSHVNIGRNECTALATLLSNTTKQLQTLKLYENNIDDEGVETLVRALSEGGSKLRDLDLSGNAAITIKGWKTLSALLERSDSNLKELHLARNNFGDEGAFIFANALRGNEKLKALGLYDNNITAEGKTYFSTLLCDTSSVNNTYLSNHTVEILAGNDSDDVRSYLRLNRSSKDKGQVAMTKVLQHHSHFSMQPFFEWEFKVLPLVIAWLEKANACTTEFDEQISNMKLSCIYDFVREFPLLYVEPVTRKVIEECSVMEEQLLGDTMQNAKLNEVQQRKTRAMRRLF